MSSEATTSVFNIQDINNGNQMSLAKVLFVFYVLIASGSVDNLLAKQLRTYIEENRYVQHIIGFFTMIVLVTLVGGVVDTRSAVVYALLGYIWFVFSTKLDLHWNLVVLILLFVGYMYENSMNVREKDIQSDNNLTEEQKSELIEKNNKYRSMIVGAVIIVTILGTIFYSHKKSEQYGGSYDIFAYMLN